MLNPFQDALSIRCQWPARVEGLDKGSERIASLFDALVKFDTRFCGWHPAVNDMAGLTSTDGVVDCGKVKSWIEDSITRENNEDAPPPLKMGYQTRLVGGFPEYGYISLSFRFDCILPSVGNYCSLQIEIDSPLQKQVSDVCAAEELLSTLVQEMDAAEGAVTCHSLFDAIRPEENYGTIGWIMYRNRHGFSATDSGQSELIRASESITFPPTSREIEDVKRSYDGLFG